MGGDGGGPVLHPIESGALEAAGYDLATRVLRIRFVDGGTYDYRDVAPELFARLVAEQPHPWSLLGDEIRAHHFTRVD